MKTQKHGWHHYLLIVLISIGLGIYAYLGNFTRMLADDYCSVSTANRLGLIGSTWHWYLNWSGRYTAFAADWAILKFSLGPYNLHYIVPATIFLWLACITSMLFLYLRKKGEAAFLHSSILAGIFLFTVFLLSPNIPQSLFWWNGMRSYVLPLVALTAYILLYQIINEYTKMSLAVQCALGFILFFASGGLGETAAVAQTIFILFLVGVHRWKGPGKSAGEVIVLSSSLAGAIFSLLVVILSPGNAIRQALLPPPPELIPLVAISLQAYGIFISGFLLEPVKAIGLTGAILISVWIGGQYKDSSPGQKRLIVLFLLGGFALSFVCFPPGVYGYSAPPPTRTMIIPVFYFVGSILYAGFLTGCWLTGRSKRRTIWLDSNAFILVTVLAVGFSLAATTIRWLNEREVYINFAKEWDAVDAQILQAKADNMEFINIPAMDGWARLDRPNENPKFWATACYTAFYGIQVYGPSYNIKPK
jgi:hypothetical protein